MTRVFWSTSPIKIFLSPMARLFKQLIILQCYFTTEAAYASTDLAIYRFKYFQLKGKPPKRKEKGGSSPPQLVRL